MNNNDIRRHKQQTLMTELLERKIRLHAQHLYDQRAKEGSQEKGSALQDWVEAESCVLENSILAPLYRKSRENNPSSSEAKEATNPPYATHDSSPTDAGA